MIGVKGLKGLLPRGKGDDAKASAPLEKQAASRGGGFATSTIQPKLVFNAPGPGPSLPPASGPGAQTGENPLPKTEFPKPPEETPAVAGLAPQDAPPAQAKKGDGDDLMSLFTEETKIDVELQHLAASLEEVDIQGLSQEAAEVVAALAELRQALAR